MTDMDKWLTSSKPGLQIDQPGLLTTLQDWGRLGQLAQGITRGGPIDERAFLWGNKLLSNKPTAAQLEITLGDLTATALNAGFWVVCGAPVVVTKNHQPQPTWQVFPVAKGDTVTIAAPPRGLRSYLAVAGGIRAKQVLGSVATVMRDGLGGLQGDGQPLKRGDTLSVGEFAPQQVIAHRRPKHVLIPRISATSILELGVIPIAQHEQFSDTEIAKFFEQTFAVTAKQDRMGVRLHTEQPLNWSHGEIISEPLPIGAIQVPPDGQPIIMLNDCQTLGGYPKIGVLSWSARMALAQATAGTQIRFVRTELSDAQEEVKQAYRFFNLSV